MNRTHRRTPPALRRLRTAALLLLPALVACDAPPDEAALPATSAEAPAEAALPPEQLAFWDAIVERCGQAFPGRLDDATPYYREGMVDAEIVAHVRECSEERIHMALHIDEDRSRNWLLTKVGGTLRLKHDHRHEDGTEEEITQYGGDAPAPGLPTRQIFPADAHTAEILPERFDNFWFMDFVDEETFTYGVHWPRHGHSIRIAFDLASPVDPPPAPWGY